MKPKPHAGGLLATDEPSPVEIQFPDGTSEILIACDHAGARLPRALGNLGLSDLELRSHIAWDIGAAGVATRLALRLDATLVMQVYSRLVVDCNRPAEAPDAITRDAEWGPVAGNVDLDASQVETRRREIFDPYHAALAEQVERRQRARRPTLLVAIHSFTPVLRSIARPWHIGVLHRRDGKTAEALLDLLRRDERLVVGDNEPYALEDTSDYTLPVHGAERGIAHVGIEIRQDLVADEAGQNTWAGRLANLLRQVAALPRAA